MRPKIALLHDAQAEAGRPDSADTLVEAQAITAALATLGYDAATVPVGLDLGALERDCARGAVCGRQSRRVARGPRPSSCTSSRRCSSRSGCRSRVAPRSRWRRPRTRSRPRSASPPPISARRLCSAARPTTASGSSSRSASTRRSVSTTRRSSAAPPCRACSRRAGPSSAAAGSPSASSRVGS